MYSPRVVAEHANHPVDVTATILHSPASIVSVSTQSTYAFVQSGYESVPEETVISLSFAEPSKICSVVVASLTRKTAVLIVPMFPNAILSSVPLNEYAEFAIPNLSVVSVAPVTVPLNHPITSLASQRKSRYATQSFIKSG